MGQTWWLRNKDPGPRGLRAVPFASPGYAHQPRLRPESSSQPATVQRLVQGIRDAKCLRSLTGASRQPHGATRAEGVTTVETVKKATLLHALIIGSLHPFVGQSTYSVKSKATDFRSSVRPAESRISSPGVWPPDPLAIDKTRRGGYGWVKV